MSKRTRATATTIFTTCAIMLLTGGCQSSGRNGGSSRASSGSPRVRHVICLYDRKPWISADAEGDRDPEGLRYRVFLDRGNNKGILLDGTFHIEMYAIGRSKKGGKKRELVSDWHYPTSTFASIRARILGDGYILSLRWASKSIAGRDVEIVTSFEDLEGRKTRASTKRLRVPKYYEYLGQAD